MPNHILAKLLQHSRLLRDSSTHPNALDEPESSSTFKLETGLFDIDASTSTSLQRRQPFDGDVRFILN